MDEVSVRTAVSPLGAGALGTSTLGLDAAATAERLGMPAAFANSIDAVGDRDVALEFLGHATILAVHLSRLAADVARFTDESLGWAELDEAYATGSSMMPQKRNPDTVELARGKAARVAAGHARLAALLQGLPLGYHRDLQEDKEPLFDAADTLELVLPALIGAVATLRFDAHAMRSAAEAEGLYATDLAEALVASGVPFREAHRRTGALLRDLASDGRGLRDLASGEWIAFGVPGGSAMLDPDRAVRARSMPGGPSPDSVRAQADALDAFLTVRRNPR
jgi:argininosuccinate lyase